MRDVIQKVMDAESEAKRILAAARTEAERMVAAAQSEGQGAINRARDEARIEAGKIVEASRLKAEKEKQTRLAGIDAEIEAQVRLDEPTRQRAAKAIVRSVCGVS